MRGRERERERERGEPTTMSTGSRQVCLRNSKCRCPDCFKPRAGISVGSGALLTATPDGKSNDNDKDGMDKAVSASSGTGAEASKVVGTTPAHSVELNVTEPQNPSSNTVTKTPQRTRHEEQDVGRGGEGDGSGNRDSDAGN